jgi:hypothetical protein
LLIEAASFGKVALVVALFILMGACTAFQIGLQRRARRRRNLR